MTLGTEPHLTAVGHRDGGRGKEGETRLRFGAGGGAGSRLGDTGRERKVSRGCHDNGEGGGFFRGFGAAVKTEIFVGKNEFFVVEKNKFFVIINFINLTFLIS